MSKQYKEFKNEGEKESPKGVDGVIVKPLGPNDLKANTWHVVKFMLVMTSCTLALRLHAGSQVYPLIAAKFGWNTKEEFESKLQLFAVVIIITGVCGVAAGTFLMRYGRRFSLRVGISTAFIGGCILLILVWPIHLYGVAIMEFGHGILIVSKARMIQEYVPQSLIGTCFCCTHIVSNSAAFFGLLTVEILPPDDNVHALKESDVWIYVLVLPVIFSALTWILLTFVITNETPLFYISQD